MSSPLGMPVMPPRTSDPPWRSAWDAALFGPEGFYRHQSPADHFRTSVHGSDLMAGAVLALARQHGLTRVLDLGAGRGELLRGLHRLDPDLELLAVEVADRPADLPAAIGWATTLPDRIDGLVVAHEWLDTIPCHVVEVDAGGEPRILHVDPATGAESPGLALTASGVPPQLAGWIDAWWPLAGREPGARAEIGSTRDRAWGDVVRRVGRGLAVAVDYGHTRETRPARGSLRSYRRGVEVEVVPDGSRDVTAAVAVDAVAAATGSGTTSGTGSGTGSGTVVLRQREALERLGVSAARPPLALAGTDPEEYAARLARSTTAAGLLDVGGPGDFYWVLSGAGGVVPRLG